MFFIESYNQCWCTDALYSLYTTVYQPGHLNLSTMSDIEQNSSDEISSYSEEEVMDVDERENENELAIEAILEDNER